MPVGLLTLELYLPDAHSLKEKRMVIRKVCDRLRARFHVAVSELDHQDLWQRSLIGVAAIASEEKAVEKILQSVEEEAGRMLAGDLVRSEMTLL